MKSLIVYYSFTSNNRKLALYLRKQLNCDIVELETATKRTGFSIMLDLIFKRKPVLKPTSCNPKDYNEVIFIGPVWAGKIATPLKSFMIREKENIREYAFVTLCGGSAGQKERLARELHETVGKEPTDVVELWISDLLKEKNDTIKNISGYRIETSELDHFDHQLHDFIHKHLAAQEPATIH